ncbi:MAG TPA: protein kinase [Xanthobacteraceae bacterium]|nr:protein kinase [Xanthobacteraceae bacterium]
MTTRTIGQYEIRQLLGEGGIGQVHAAFDTVLEREVAIKSLRPELLSDKSFIDRFRGEAKSLALLNHPNITTLYSLLPDGGNLSMVMELVRGDTLDVLLKKREGALGIQESLAIIAQAADGLAYAHSMGVIHRDIKPANLMITQGGLLKIMDFGIARVRGSQRLTRDGSMVGTLAYMAPEQLRGDPGDERSDLYSLAIVLYELLSGAPPFEAQSDYDLMQMHIAAKPRRLMGRLPDLNPKVEAALMRALAKKPEQRFASARAFSDELGATALRVDASKIVAEGTRLIGRPPAEALQAPAEKAAITDTFDKVSTAVDARLGFVPAEWRMPAAIGIATLMVAGALTAGALTLMPGATQAPASTASTDAPQRGATIPPAKAPEVSYRSVDIAPTSPPASPSGAAPPSSSLPLTAPATVPAGASGATPVNRPAASAFDRAAFVAAVGHKDFATAIAMAQPDADNGDRDAQFRVAYLNDSAGPNKEHPNDALAAAWYRRAADKGHVVAAFNLASMYEEGRGIGNPSETEAFRWFLKAAEGNDAEAQNRVGYMYETGSGTLKDEFGAARWYGKAAAQGLAKAMDNLANMYASGRGVDRKDEAAALKLYQQAADKGFAKSEEKLGWWYENGLGGLTKNAETAAAWYEKAAAHGAPRAQADLDRLRGSGQLKQ